MFKISQCKIRHTKQVMLGVTLLFIFVAGCSENESNLSEQLHSPQPIETGEECHLCGMAITQFPGPKGQTFSKHSHQTKKFCSTNDLFSFLLQPENKHTIAQAFVHDMSEEHWDKPNDSKMIDAKSAWYVTGHKLRGAMGPTLASFASKEKAEFFTKLNGGQILSFEQITLATLTNISAHHH